jgi:hypothetical protein
MKKVYAEYSPLSMKAEVASRDIRKQKQDRYAEVRRRKDEEREAEELRKVWHASYASK